MNPKELEKLRAELRRVSDVVERAWQEHQTQVSNLTGDGERESAPSPAGTPNRVRNVALSPGEIRHSLHVSWDPLEEVSVYEIQVTTDPQCANWTSKTVTDASSTVLWDFVPGSSVVVRVRAAKDGEARGPWSEPACRIVL